MSAVAAGAARSGRDRRRASTSLCLRNERLLRAIICASWDTRFGPKLTPQTLGPSNPEPLAAGRAELADGPRFFSHFRGAVTVDRLRGARVLDVGSGYGGRTVYYARECGAAEAIGIEPFREMVELSERLARVEEVENVAFEVATAEQLPFPPASFDTVVSFDVLEHVDDPAPALLEIARVLRPRGSALLVFPTYLGARSSHLDYITRVPALHRIFDPDTVVDTVNELLVEAGDRIPVQAQPRPRRTALGRLTLPGLNGLTLRDARALVARSGLQPRRELLTPVVDEGVPLPLARPVAAMLRHLLDRVGAPELLVGSIALELERQS